MQSPKILLILTSLLLTYCQEERSQAQSSLLDENALNPGPFTGPIEYVDDVTAKLGDNTSGITYQPKSVTGKGFLWAVKNTPPELYKLSFNNSSNSWVKEAEWPVTTPSGSKVEGEPDIEAVTKADWKSSMVYMTSERLSDKTSRLSILAFDTSTAETTLEWNLTHEAGNSDTVDITVKPNRGWEGLTWIPDKDLLTGGFVDQRLQKTYDPSDYPSHGAGIFAAGLERDGTIYLFTLNHADGSFAKLGQFSAGFDEVMGLEYDRSTGYLWIHCDENCENSSKVFELDSSASSDSYGEFTGIEEFARPAGLSNSNYEGIAIFPDEECQDGQKPFFWIDDNGEDESALSRGYIPCGRFIP